VVLLAATLAVGLWTASADAAPALPPPAPVLRVLLVAGPTSASGVDTQADIERVRDGLDHLVPGALLEVTVLTSIPGPTDKDHAATVANVEDAWAAMARKARPGDTIMLVFAGHGVPRTDQPFSLSLEGGRLPLPLLASVLPDPRERAYRVVLVLDACFLGTTHEDDEQNSDRFGFSPVPGAIVFGASSALRESRFLRMGPVTNVVMSGLHGAADENLDGVVTYGELQAFFRASLRGRAAALTPSTHVPPKDLLEPFVRLPTHEHSLELEIRPGTPRRVLVSSAASDHLTYRKGPLLLDPASGEADARPVVEVWRDHSRAVLLSLPAGTPYLITSTDAREGTPQVLHLRSTEAVGPVRLELPGDDGGATRDDPEPPRAPKHDCESSSTARPARLGSPADEVRYLQCTNPRNLASPLVPRVRVRDRRLGPHVSFPLSVGVEFGEVYGRKRRADVDALSESLQAQTGRFERISVSHRPLVRLEGGIRGHPSSGFFLQALGSVSVGPRPSSDSPLGGQIRGRGYGGFGALLLPSSWGSWLALDVAAGVLGVATEASSQSDYSPSTSTGFSARLALSLGVTDRLVRGRKAVRPPPVQGSIIGGLDLLPILVDGEPELRPHLYVAVELGFEQRVR